jgi:hypothetical protein
MKKLTIFLTIFLLGILGINTMAQKRKPVRMRQTQPVRSDFRTLVEETQGGTETPFIFVARSGEALSELKKLVANLPDADIDFDKTAIVAAFAGQQRTSGYGVAVTKIADGAKIALIAPPKDAMTLQVLTAPFNVVLVPIDKDKALKVEADRNWQARMTRYRVTKSNFTASGGFAGTKTEFAANGSLEILRAGDFVTAFLNLAANTKPQKSLADVATGNIENGEINLWRIDAGNFVQKPRPPLRASGKFDEKQINLIFESLPTNVADGFQGQGTLTAVK